jgi:hypothetical protein
MKRNTIVWIIALMTILFTSSIQAKNDPVKAMWVWDYYKSANTQEQREQLIQFSLTNDINLLFVGTRGTLVDYHYDEYAELIGLAHANGIRIFALAGEASWALEKNHTAALRHIKQVLDYNSNYPENRFDGISLDIEPHTLSGYSDNAGSIGYQFLRLLEAAVNIISKNGDDDVELDAAVPFWYSSGGRTIKYNDVRKPLSHHILDLVDSVSIMAYRDQADAQIELAKNDVLYAASIGRKAYIGAETMPPDGERIPENITYNNEKISYMNDELEAIHHYYSKHPGFGGIAIHSYESFKEMLQSEERKLEQQFNALKAAGIMTGYTDGSAGFGKTATRAEVAAIIARLGGYTDANLHKPVKASFLDVRQGQWFYGWIESAHKMGVMQGKGSRSFDPNSNISVEEALIVTARAIGMKEIKGAAIPGASIWSQGWVRAMIDAQLIEPRKNYLNDITREDLVSLIYDTYRIRNQ